MSVAVHVNYRFILHISDSFNPAQQLVSEWVSGQLHNINDHSTEDAIWSDEENINGNNNYEPSIRNIIAQQDAGALSMEGMSYIYVHSTYYIVVRF